MQINEDVPIGRAKLAYLFTKRQTRTIEIIKEKDFVAFKKAKTKKEQKELDELSVMRARLKDQEAEEEIA